MIQTPDDSTNMFIDIRTSIFATYLFLTGVFKIFYNYMNIQIDFF